MNTRYPENLNCDTTVELSTSDKSMQKHIEKEMQNIDAIFSKKLSINEIKDPDVRTQCKDKKSTSTCGRQSSTTSLELIEEKRKLSDELTAIDKIMLDQCKTLQTIAYELEISKQDEKKSLSETSCTIVKPGLDNVDYRQNNVVDCDVNTADIPGRNRLLGKLMQPEDDSDFDCYNIDYEEEYCITGSSIDMNRDSEYCEVTTDNNCNDFYDVSHRPSENNINEMMDSTRRELQNGARIIGGDDLDISFGPRNDGVSANYDELEGVLSVVESQPCLQNFLPYDEDCSQEYDWQEDDWQEIDWENMFHHSVPRTNMIPIRPRSS